MPVSIGAGIADLLGGLFAAAPEAAAATAATDVAATAPLDLLAGGTAAGTAAPLATGALAPVAAGGGLGTAMDVAGGLGGGLGVAGTDVTGGVLTDAQIADLMTSPGAGAFASTGGAVTAPTITGAGAGASVLPGTTGLGGDVAMGSSVGDVAGLNPSTAPFWSTTPIAPDATLTGGTLPTGAGGTVPFTPGAAVGAGGTPNVFGPGPTPFDTGGASPVPFGGAGGGAPPPGATSPGFFDQLSSAFAPAGSALKTVAPALGVAGLGYNFFQGYESQQQLKALQAQETAYQNQIAGAGQASLQAAQPMIVTAEALMGTGTGPIPAPMQAILDNYRNSQRARIIQGYTSQGQSGDPTKNLSLAQDLNAVDNQMLALQESIGTQMLTTANSMLSTGANATQIAAELPMMMQRLDIQLQQMTGTSIANFAAAMSGGTMKVAGPGTGGVNLNFNTPAATTTQTLLG